MTKRNKVSILILLAYCVPYVFLGMYGDKNFHNLWLYGLMMLVLQMIVLVVTKRSKISN